MTRTTRTETAAADAPAAAPGALGRLLLTGDPVQALRLRQSGLALLLMAVSVGLLQYAVWVGAAEPAPIAWWTLYSVGGLVAAWLAIRSGWSARLADPALTVPQMVYAIACAAVGYALLGPLRGMVMTVLALILMFGMFQLRGRTAMWITAYALLLFGLAMAGMAKLRPEVYRPAVELGHFMMLLCMLPAVTLLAERMTRIRRRLRLQRQELAEALQKIQALATRDELTGLLNRRHMQTLLEQERQRRLRSGQAFCLALIDIDHFKQINDGHGHGAGDAALREFASAAQQAIRGTDVLARWGGEEFVLLLTDTSMPPAQAAVERLRERIAALVVIQAGRALNLTISAGLTESLPQENLAQTLERADKLLYRAKAEGRNRVVVG
ncbi:GGDEF domain-containing protein [Roseateles violae]|uniref:diguanylate cyclase n=1 Tax=Roseateles violae TaxID=3058042 RepID=A0ABT8DTG9_9BURK|nr:GGDEF domain-containing protein [Pelomonas sp. PFR6]MDN3919667.1 GGDEF domain-containing protein [Pelomonas sp. PFR6]